MLKSALCVSMAIGAMTLVGCKDDETKSTAPPAVTPPNAALPATMPAIPETPTPPAITPPATQPSAAVPAVPPTPAVPATPAVPEATAPAAPTADAVDPEAKSLMAQVEDAIKNKKWDDADAALKKLVAMKDKLPASWQDKLGSLKAAIDGGKLSSKLPGFGQ